MANRTRTERTLREETIGDPPQRDRPQEVAASREEIERRAYDLYQQRGASDGRALDDWLQAERDLQQQ